MSLLPLNAVKHRLAVGRPLPFNVLRRDGTLLLAKGKMLDSVEQLHALLDRGLLVAMTEFFGDAHAISMAPRELLPGLWADNRLRVGEALRRAGAEGFRAALDEVSAPVLALVERDPDLAIFQILRQDANDQVQYGLDHSLHAAVVSRLVAERLGWCDADITRAFKAALTMNVSMLELQGQLAMQPTPPSESQRRQIRSHPGRSRELLERSGVEDAAWLEAVDKHHECPDGSGYPSACTDVPALATLLQCADRYTTKLSARVTREALPADQAAREIFRADPSSPIHAALVKAVGVYPPGCLVRLANGESAVVVARGQTVMAPMVASLADSHGTPWPSPRRLDTTQREHAVASVLPARALPATLSTAALARLALA